MGVYKVGGLFLTDGIVSSVHHGEVEERNCQSLP